jgi:hypothetical protein
VVRKIVHKAVSLAHQVSTYAQTAEEVERAAAMAEMKIQAVSKKIQETPLLSSEAERELSLLLPSSTGCVTGAIAERNSRR